MDRFLLIRDIVDDYIEKIEVDKNKNLVAIHQREAMREDSNIFS
ncbi:hypothetical protein [Oceanirhabdus sp. W0125-5]|nr:hypothetical protein [Oceanirhabdus sp. W0125-5]WBW94858.1 hypothetical protein OW730_14255 [Oceanirhabdus sp. W0125-5]